MNSICTTFKLLLTSRSMANVRVHLTFSVIFDVRISVCHKLNTCQAHWTTIYLFMTKWKTRRTQNKMRQPRKNGYEKSTMNNFADIQIKCARFIIWANWLQLFRLPLLSIFILILVTQTHTCTMKSREMALNSLIDALKCRSPLLPLAVAHFGLRILHFWPFYLCSVSSD